MRLISRSSTRATSRTPARCPKPGGSISTTCRWCRRLTAALSRATLRMHPSCSHSQSARARARCGPGSWGATLLRRASRCSCSRWLRPIGFWVTAGLTLIRSSVRSSPPSPNLSPPSMIFRKVITPIFIRPPIRTSVSTPRHCGTLCAPCVKPIAAQLVLNLCT